MTDDLTDTPVDTGADAAVSDETPSIDDALGAIWEEKNSGETDATSPEPETDGETTQETTDQPQPEGGELETPAIASPNAWSAEMKGKWADVPPDIQAYIAERETDAHAQITQMGQEIAGYKPIRELLDQNLGIFDANGVGVEQGLSALLNAQRMLDSDPMQGIAAIAQAYGIDLTQAFGPQGNGDPQMQALQAQVSQLTNQLTQRDNQSRMSQERQNQARMSEVQSQVETWGQDKEHFAREDVRNMMGTLIQSGQAPDLDAAYEAACHAIPEIRSAIAEKAKAAQEAKAKKEREAAIKDAKKARKTNLGGKGGGVPATGQSPNDDAYLGDVFDRVVSG